MGRREGKWQGEEGREKGKKEKEKKKDGQSPLFYARTPTETLSALVEMSKLILEYDRIDVQARSK